MNSDTIFPPAPVRRMPTGIPGLDVVLHGGLIRGATYFVVGEPGAGKTILANHLCFNQAARGDAVLYITLLGAEHAWLLSYLGAFDFFDPAAVGSKVYYLSGFGALQTDGLQGLRDLIQREIRSHNTTVAVVDSMMPVEGFAESPLAFHLFVRDLQVYAAAMGCTIVLLGYVDGGRPHPEFALPDGVIELRHVLVGVHTVRQLEVMKFRGGTSMKGIHSFEIDQRGVAVYPRLEALLALPTTTFLPSRERAAFGLPTLDRMLHGGLLAGSTTMTLGAPGSGKIPLGAAFLAEGARQGEPCLLFGFYEMPPMLISKSDQLGLDFGRYANDGLIEIIWQPPVEMNLDRLAHQLLAAVDGRGVRRLVLDGLDGFEQAAYHEGRLDPFLIALSNELRARNVTTVLTVEVEQFFGPAVDVPAPAVSALADTVILLYYVKERREIQRRLAVLKMRGSLYSTEVHDLRFTEHGIELARLPADEGEAPRPSSFEGVDPLGS